MHRTQSVSNSTCCFEPAYLQALQEALEVPFQILWGRVNPPAIQDKTIVSVLGSLLRPSRFLDTCNNKVSIARKGGVKQKKTQMSPHELMFQSVHATTLPN